ncbi:hypothetical protein [Brevundimonas vesicularis]|uniref:hypothetical protein n=1 Tax=Brevundimonas vesicularis TaxID=41276 RepID=UPI0038D44085
MIAPGGRTLVLQHDGGRIGGVCEKGFVVCGADNLGGGRESGHGECGDRRALQIAVHRTSFA